MDFSDSFHYFWSDFDLLAIKQTINCNQTSNDITTSRADSRAKSRVNRLRQSLCGYDDVEECNYDSTELGKKKIRKDRHQNQTPYDDYITLYLLGELSDS